MKNSIFFFLLVALVAIIVGCAEKMPTDSATPSAPDTVTIHDTDTVYDTTVVVDTTILHDTTVVIDTIYLDSNQTGNLCGEIGSCHKTIAWFIPLTPGDYQFDFVGVTEKDQPAQELAVKIGTAPYVWPIAGQKEFSITQNVTADGVWVVITSNPPPARGHKIQICLLVRKL